MSRLFAGIDIARGLQTKGAYSEIWVLEEREGAPLTVKASYRFNGTFSETVDMIVAAHDTTPWGTGLLENSGFAKSVSAQLAQRHKEVPVEGYYVGSLIGSRLADLKDEIAKGELIQVDREFLTADYLPPIGLWLAWQAHRRAMVAA